MFNKKMFISIFVFSFLLFCTSIVKNKTRVIEKNIEVYKDKISYLNKELKESQIEFYYLTSPKIIQEKIVFLSNDEYQYMSISKIYSDYKSFISENNKISKK